jgi:hypothetical protein
MRGEDRDMALMRLAQDESDLLLQPVFASIVGDQRKRGVVGLISAVPGDITERSPPMRSCTRGPHVIKAKHDLVGRGPSLMPISIASK